MSRLFCVFIPIIFVNSFAVELPAIRIHENLPLLKKTFEIVDGNKVTTNQQKRPIVVVSPRINEDGETYWIPLSIDQAIQEVEAMLPPEYYKLLMSRYVKGLEPHYDDSAIARFYDEFTQYLYSIWNIPESILGKKLYCMGVLERDLSVFLVIAASNYANNNGALLKDEYRKDLDKFLQRKNKCEKMRFN